MFRFEEHETKLWKGRGVFKTRNHEITKWYYG